MASKETVRVESTDIKQARATVRGFEMWVDKPPELNGKDRGPMPSEYFLAALGSCMAFTVRGVAEKRKVPLESLEVVAEATFDDRGLVTGLSLEHLVRSPAPLADVERVVELSSRVCTVAKLLGDVPLEKTVTLLNGGANSPPG